MRLSASFPKLKSVYFVLLCWWFTDPATSLWNMRFPCTYSFSKRVSSSLKVEYQHFLKHQTCRGELLLGPSTAIAVEKEIGGGSNIRKTALHLWYLISYNWQFNLLKLHWSRASGAPVNWADAKYSRYLHRNTLFFMTKKKKGGGVWKLHPAPWQFRTWRRKKKKKRAKKGIAGTKAEPPAKKEVLHQARCACVGLLPSISTSCLT